MDNENYEPREEKFHPITDIEVDQKAAAKNKKWGLISLILALVGLLVFGIPLGGAAIGGGIYALKDGSGSKALAILAILIGAFDIISVLFILPML